MKLEKNDYMNLLRPGSAWQALACDFSLPQICGWYSSMDILQWTRVRVGLKGKHGQSGFLQKWSRPGQCRTVSNSTHIYLIVLCSWKLSCTSTYPILQFTEAVYYMMALQVIPSSNEVPRLSAPTTVIYDKTCLIIEFGCLKSETKFGFMVKDIFIKCYEQACYKIASICLAL